MKKKYRAMQIVAPGVLEMTERPVPAPGPDEVIIKIEACGVCGADLRDAEKAPQAGQPGRIPGHEIVGFIARKGNRVTTLPITMFVLGMAACILPLGSLTGNKAGKPPLWSAPAQGLLPA